MTVDNTENADVSTEQSKSRKPRSKSIKKIDTESVKVFWSSPPEAFFKQETIALIANCAIKTLESDRWKGGGIPFRKINGRILYKKSEVVNWLDGHPVVTSTSNYADMEANHE